MPSSSSSSTTSSASQSASASTTSGAKNVDEHHDDDDDERQQRNKLRRRQTAAAVVAVQHASVDVTRRMVCGGIAGMVAKTVTNPLERIKMLSQTTHYRHRAQQAAAPPSILGLYRDILSREGVLGLWAGNGANLLRIFPSKAVVFSTNDYYRAGLLRLVLGDDNPRQRQQQQNSKKENDTTVSVISFLAGGLAGMTATACTYPLDLARGRISGRLAERDTGQKVYKGIGQTLYITFHDEGLRGLYRGITPTLLGAMPYVGIQFGTVGFLERCFPLKSSTTSDDDDDVAGGGGNSSNRNTPLRKMLFGGLGGVTAGLLTYPNDTVRRLLQLQGSRGSSSSTDQQRVYAGYWDCVRQTHREYGIPRFYRGMTINIVRMAPNTAVQFGTYELLKQRTERWS